MPTQSAGPVDLFYDRLRVSPPPVAYIQPDVKWSSVSGSMLKITDVNPTVKRKKPSGDRWTVFLAGTPRLRSRTTKFAKSVLNRSVVKEYVSGVIRHYDTMPDTHFGHGFAKTSNPVYQQLAYERTKCLNKAIGQARANSVNLGMMLAEYRQTASLFRSGSQLLVKATVAAVTRNPKLLAPRGDWSKKTSQAHLAYIYGVAPLVSDLHDAGRAMRQVRDYFFTSGSATTVAKVDKRYAQASQHLLSRQCGVNVSVHEQSLLITRTKYMVKLNANALLSSMGQFGLTNPLALAWELIPFSFVIDWWVNVGETLSSLDNVIYFGDARYQQVSSFMYRQTATHAPWGVPSTYMYEEYNRTGVGPMPSITSLQYKSGSSLRHILAGLSLINVNRKRFGF